NGFPFLVTVHAYVPPELETVLVRASGVPSLVGEVAPLIITVGVLILTPTATLTTTASADVERYVWFGGAHVPPTIGERAKGLRLESVQPLSPTLMIGLL